MSFNEQNIAEPALVVLDVTADEDTIRVVMDGIQQQQWPPPASPRYGAPLERQGSKPGCTRTSGAPAPRRRRGRPMLPSLSTSAGSVGPPGLVVGRDTRAVPQMPGWTQAAVTR